MDVEASRKRLELFGETCCWLLLRLDEDGNPTNSQSTFSEAGSLLRPPARLLEKAYLERLRILVRKLFILMFVGFFLAGFIYIIKKGALNWED